MESNNNNKIILVVGLILVAGVMSALLYFFVLDGDSSSDESELEGSALADMITEMESLRDSSVYSYNNKGTFEEFPIPVDRGSYTCRFLVYDDYAKEGDLNADSDIRFIILNQSSGAITSGIHNGQPALYVNKPEGQDTYTEVYQLISKGGNDPIKVQTYFADHTSWYIQCYEPFELT